MAFQGGEIPRLMHVILGMGVGGAEKLVYDMARHPYVQENKPVICCLDMVGQLGEKLQEEGFNVYVPKRKNGFDYSLIFWLRDIIRKERIDIVHAHQYTPLFYTVPAAKMAGKIKVVYTEHGRLYPDSRKWKRYLINPFLALGVDHIVAISNSTRDSMHRYDNFPLRRIKVVNNGVDIPAVAPEIDLLAKRRSLDLDENSRVIGTVGRLVELKNFPMIFRVFRQLLENIPDMYLLVAGRGSVEEELRALAKELGITERVRFLGLRLDLSEIYRLIEVFVLSSFTEGISISILEAMANGIPVVATNVGGNPEVVVDGMTGRLVPLCDDNVMAEKILELLNDRCLAHQFGERGCERVRRQFSFDGMMDSYRGIYLAFSRDYSP